jgi:aminoglycoside 3-N-acetyltransferase
VVPIDLTRDLGVRAGDILFVHASLDRIGADAGAGQALVSRLLEAVGSEGSVFMPSYPWPPPSGFPPPGSVFNVRRTPSRAGLLSEMFRRSPGVTRSESYYLPLAGCGRYAPAVLSDQIGVAEPFGWDSSFGRLARDSRTRILGLGVSLNTTSFIHVADHALYRRYGFPYYDATPATGTVICVDGRVEDASTLTVRADLHKRMRPARLFDISERLRTSLVRYDVGSTINFSYPAKLFVDEAVEIGKEALDRGKSVPWIEMQR